MTFPLLCPKWLLAIIVCLSLSVSFANAQTITTVAGGLGDGYPALTHGRIKDANFVILDGAGNLYCGDQNLGSGVRMMNLATGIITSKTDGGRGEFDAAGNWYYISGNSVYKKTPAGNVTLIAGNGSTTYSGDGSLAVLAGIRPLDLALDMSGNIYIADYSNHRVRKVNSLGIISTVAGNGIGGFSGDGGSALTASISFPYSVAIDVTGNIFIADYDNHRIRKVDASGIITTYGGGGSLTTDVGAATTQNFFQPTTVRVDGAGNVYVFIQGYAKICKINTAGIISRVAGNGVAGIGLDGGPANLAALSYARDFKIDAVGNIYIADGNSNRIRQVNTAGIINTIAGNTIALIGDGGDGGSAILAKFSSSVGGIVQDGIGNIYIADAGNHRVRKVNTSGIATTYAGIGIAGFFGDGGAATVAALSTPTGLALDKLGNLYIAESGSNHVRRVTPSGIISTVAGGGLGGLGDGGPATNANLTANGIAVDTNGNIFIADGGNKRIRKVDAVSGIITTFAGTGIPAASGDGGPATNAGLNNPIGVAVDNKGNLFIAGSTIRKINSSGVITSLPASGTAITADTMGNLYIPYGTTLRRLDIYNYLSVVAGVGIAGYTGDNGPATAARLSAGNGIHIDPSGRLYFATVNGVRRICCMSYDIDRPPLFTRGAIAALAACTSSGAVGIDSLLSITDGDVGDNETWTILSPPDHGTLSGFPYAAISTGSTIIPSGLTYTPSIGYSGSDYFTIKINDGEDTGTIHINVLISPPPAAAIISGATEVCIADTIALSASHSGGIWSISNSNATINASGMVAGVAAGIDTVTYTRTTGCGTASSTYIVTINPLPYALIAPGISAVCVSSSVVLSGTSPGGNWGSVSPYVSVSSSTGTIVGLAPGPAIVSYSVSNSCGIAWDTTVIVVNSLPSAGIISGTTTLCTGGTTTLSSTVPGGTWYSGNPLVAATTGSTGVVTGVAAGAALITYAVSSAGCGSAIAATIINVTAATPILPTSGPSSVCAGSVIALTNASPGGTWSSSAPAVATVSSTGTVTGISPGAATISYTASLGCGVSVAMANVAVHAAAISGTISGPSAICTGVSNVMMSTASGGVWSSSNSNAAISPAGIISGITSGTSTISYTVTNSCGSATSVQSVGIYPSPVAGTITGPGTICGGNTATLANTTGTPGGVWSSGNSLVATIGSAGIITGVAAGTSLISYTVATGCGIVSATKIVTVIVPDAGIITGTTTVCAGGSSILSSTVAGGFWSSSTPAVAVVGSTGVVTAISGGASVISYSVTGFCGTTTSSAIFTVGALPVVSPITGTTTICAGATTILANATIGGTWSSSHPSVATIGSAGFVTSIAPGTAIISYMVTAGCGTSGVTALLHVNSAPSAGIISGAPSVCAGSVEVMTASVSGGVWSSGNPFLAPISSTGAVTGIAPGTVTISYAITNTCGAALATSSIEVKVPEAGTISGLTTLCPGFTTILTSTIPGGTWSSSIPAVATISATGMAHAIAPGTSILSYTVTDACGTASTTALFTTGSLPIVSEVKGPDKLCIGSSTTFNNATTGGIWTTNEPAIATVNATGLVTAVAQGACTISYTVTGGCGTSASIVAINVEATPEPGTISGDAIVCAGKSIALQSTVTGGVWSSNDLLIATIAHSGSLTGQSPGTVIVTYTVSNSCGSAAATTIETIVGPPSAGVVSGDLNICTGASAMLSGSVAGGIWTSENPSVATVTADGVVAGLTPGTSAISYTVANACGANSALAVVAVNTLPQVAGISGKDIIVAGRKTELNNAVSGGLWTSSDTTIATVSADGVVAAINPGPTLIKYRLINSFGCSIDTSMVLNVIPKGIIMFNIYPNPASRELTISWRNNSVTDARIIISDIAGRTVHTSQIEMPDVVGKTQLGIQGIPDGVYSIIVHSADGDYVSKLVILEQ